MLLRYQTRTYKKSAAAQHQVLSPEIPGTIGFEVEDLFYHGPGLGISVEILVKESNGQEVKRYHPHEYFKAEQPSLPGNYDTCGACGKSMAGSELMDITLDVVEVPRVGFIRVLEFVTVPLTLVENTGATLTFFSNTITDLYTYATNMRKEEKKTVELEDWMKSYNAKDYARDYPINKSNILVPENIESKKTAHPSLNIGRPIDPRFAIHVNTSILLEQMYTLEMRDAFPIFDDYPPVCRDGKVYELKDWPSCRRNPYFEDFELSLTKHVNTAVDVFCCAHLKDLRAYFQARVKGFLRTLIYCYCMETYYESTQRQWEFPENKYYTSCGKDFYLHGIPKVKFDWLAMNGLTTHEKEVLKSIVSKDTGIKEVESLFSDVLKKIHHSKSEAPWFCTQKGGLRMERMNIHEFIRQVLVLPLMQGEMTGVKLNLRTLELSLPRIEIDGETVDVPVLEFRAPMGNGCSLSDLENLLATQADYAKSFSKKGFEVMEKYRAQPGNKNLM